MVKIYTTASKAIKDIVKDGITILAGGLAFAEFRKTSLPLLPNPG